MSAPQHKKLFPKTILTTLLGIGVVFGGIIHTPVTAASSAIDTKKNQIDTINQKISAYKDMVALKQKEQSYLATQIQTLDTQSQQIQSDISAKQATIGSLDNQITTLESKISDKTDLIAQQQQILAELLRTYYAQRSSLDPKSSNAFIIGSTEQVNADARTNDWTEDISSKVNDLAISITQLRQSLIDEQVKVKDSRTQLDSARLQLEQQNQYLDATKQKQSVVLATAQSAEKQYKGIISDLQQQRDEIEQEIQTLEQAKVDQLDLSKLPKFGTSLFIYPVTNPYQSQGYGKTDFAKGRYGGDFHNGLDFADKTGTPIYAGGAGTVIGVGDCGQYAYGKWVAIDHGNGLVTLYGHMSKQKVSKGDSVNQGQQIGLMGATGYATGPHVHFAVFAKNSFDVVESKSVPGIMIPTGATVNPKNYLP